jgi:hypothetical protein
MMLLEVGQIDYGLAVIGSKNGYDPLPSLDLTYTRRYRCYFSAAVGQRTVRAR